MEGKKTKHKIRATAHSNTLMIFKKSPQSIKKYNTDNIRTMGKSASSLALVCARAS